MSEIVSTVKKDYIVTLVKSGKRVDGRSFDEYRPLSISLGFAGKAEGSAMVLLGETRVLVGIKADIGAPYPDTPDKGVLITNAEFVPLASPTFEPGPPDENAIELARVVDRGVRSSNAVELEKLVIKEGEKVWVLFADIWVLNHDGNLFDASSIGLIAALLNTKIPAVELEGDKVKVKDEWRVLPVKKVPISVTIAKVGNQLLVDPCLDEEEVMEGRITITLDDEGNVCAIQKGPGEFTVEDVYKAFEIARKVAPKIREKILEVVKNANKGKTD